MGLLDRVLNINITAADRSKPGFDAVKARIDGLKRQLGEDSALGGIAKIMSGAGAIAGAVVITKSLDNMATKAEELEGAFRRGEIGAAGITAELARTVPILGNIVTAGEKFSRILDGTAAFAERLDRIEGLNTNLGNAINNLGGSDALGASSFKAFIEKTVADRRRRNADKFGVEALDNIAFTNASRKRIDEIAAGVQSGAAAAKESLAAADAEIAKMQAEASKLRSRLTWNELRGQSDLQLGQIRLELDNMDGAILRATAQRDRLQREISESEKEVQGGRARALSAARVDELERSFTLAKDATETIFDGIVKIADTVIDRRTKLVNSKAKLFDAIESAAIVGLTEGLGQVRAKPTPTGRSETSLPTAIESRTLTGAAFVNPADAAIREARREQAKAEARAEDQRRETNTKLARIEAALTAVAIF